MARLPSICCRGECRAVPTLLPVVLVWPNRAEHPGAPESRIQFGLPMCARCSRDVTPKLLITPESWKLFVKKFWEERRQRPDIFTVQLQWISITSPEALSFLASIPEAGEEIVH